MKLTLITLHFTKWELDNLRADLKPLIEQLEDECEVIDQGIYLAETDSQAGLIGLARHRFQIEQIPSAIVPFDLERGQSVGSQPPQIVRRRT